MGIRVTNNMISSTMLTNTQNTTSKIFKIQEQVSSGNKISNSSENPYDAMQVLKLGTHLDQLSDWSNNIANAKNQIEMAYDSLTLVEENLQRISELSVRLASDVNSNETNQAILSEINERAKILESLANTQYQGDYIFGGSNTKNQTYILAPDMTVTYGGSTQNQNWQKLLEISDGEEIQANVLGYEIFGDNAHGIFKAIKDMNNVVETKPFDVNNVLKAQEEIQSSIISVTNTMSELGAYSSKADVAESINTKMTTRLKSNKADLKETDLVEAATDLSLAQTSLKATLQVGAMLLGGASLLDYV